MLRRTLHIAVTGYLAILLLFGTTSKEFVHLFVHHEETVHTHRCIHKHEAHIDHAHHHCSFLSFVLEPFANDIQFPYIALRAAAVHHVYEASVVQELIPVQPAAYYLRGPPLV